MTPHALTDERVAEMLNNRASSTVAGWDYELRCAMLATLAAHDSALNHERVISADLRENLKASQAHHAAADEEIERLRAEVSGLEQNARADLNVTKQIATERDKAEARVAQLEAALREIAMLDYEGQIVPGSYLEIARAVLSSKAAGR